MLNSKLSSIAAFFVSIFTFGPLIRFTESNSLEDRSAIEEVKTPEVDQEVELIHLIDETSQRIADALNTDWRKAIEEKLRNPQEWQENADLYFAATVNTIAKEHNKDIRVDRAAIRQSTRFTLDEGFQHDEHMWVALKGLTGVNVNRDKDKLRKLQNIVNGLEEDRAETVDEIIASLPKLIRLPPRQRSSDQSIAQDISDLTK